MEKRNYLISASDRRQPEHYYLMQAVTIPSCTANG
jgi:hypothetical protein